jgi:type IX secretion system PorP/SprF family membrane protein
MRKLLAILFMVFIGDVAVQAQDPHFSQFFASPLTLNPALTGKFSGLLRVAGNYRDQWPSISKAFVTSTISVDGAVMRDKLPYTDTWGVGVMAMSDKTANGILNSTFFAVSTAYHKGLDEDGNHQIAVGFQGTYSNKRLDGQALKFADGLQLDGTWLPSPTEPINTQTVNASYFDVNAGVLYSGTTNGENNFYAGISTYHINRPQESFIGGTYTLKPRTTVHGGGYFPVAYNATVHVSGLHSRQAGAAETVIGGAVALRANDDVDKPTNVYLGTWYRFGDAFIPYVGLEFGGFRLGATYDVNTSSLNTASQKRGGIEISLIYIQQPIEGRKDIPCPKF